MQYFKMPHLRLSWGQEFISDTFQIIFDNLRNYQNTPTTLLCKRIQQIIGFTFCRDSSHCAWAPGGPDVTPKPSFRGLVTNHQVLKQSEAKKLLKAAKFDQKQMFLGTF